MINSWAYDVESLPNFFSIVFVDINDYLKIFNDACNITIKKGKEIKTPIPLVQKYFVKEITEKLDNVNKKKFYITDKDDSQLMSLLSFINELRPHRNEKGIAIRNDLFGYNSDNYDKLMVAALLMFYNQCNNTTELIYRLYTTSKHIIDMQDNYELSKNDFLLTNLRKFAIPYTNIDIMKIFALNKVGKGIDSKGNTIYFGKSLKQTSINLQWYELLEYELPPISDLDNSYYKKNPIRQDFTNEELNKVIDKWDRYIIPEWIEPTMHYNTNDVYIVCEMVRLFIDEIRLRYNITKTYEIDCLSSSRSNMADKLFVKFYSDFSGLQPFQWRGKHTDRTIMSLNKVIFPFIKFKTKALQDVLDDMKLLSLTSIGKDGLRDAVESAYNANLLKSSIKEDFGKIKSIADTEYITKLKKNPCAKRTELKYEGINIKINNLTYTIATGGLHSKDFPRELKSKLILKSDNEQIDWNNITDDSFIYVHWDISSFYPSIMDKYSIAPAHMNEGVFVRLVKWLKDTRIAAKHSTEDYIDGIPKDILAQALKIVINSIYGKFGFKDGDLYDRMATLKVTINGQLMIIMLCEELELNNIEVISANTDGIVVKLYKKDKNKFDEISKNWKKLTQLDADSEEYKIYINRDINNYIAQELNNKLTFKGALNPYSYLNDLSKGYDMPIVAESVYQFFINDIPVLDTLYNCTNILDFCKTQNIGHNFKVLYVENEKQIELQRNIRFYASNNGGIIYKIDKTTGQYNNLCSDSKVTVLNTLDDKNIAFRDISYQYYYNEAYKIIDPIKLGISPNQKADNIAKTKSGKKLINQYKGQYKSLFDEF